MVVIDDNWRWWILTVIVCGFWMVFEINNGDMKEGKTKYFWLVSFARGRRRTGSFRGYSVVVDSGFGSVDF